MSQLSEIVDSLENRISKLLHNYKKLGKENERLAATLSEMKIKEENSKAEISELQSKCSSLQLANSMLGSDTHKRDTKLKINALIREIDQCITQLSE
jgi:predicted  nucleic acid-binding Zn-ribbon protein